MIKQQGLDFYIIPSIVASSEESTKVVEDMYAEKGTDEQAFNVYRKHIDSMVWKTGEAEVSHGSASGGDAGSVGLGGGSGTCCHASRCEAARPCHRQVLLAVLTSPWGECWR